MPQPQGQSHQERSYQEYCAAKAKEKAQQLESSYEKTVSVQQTEMNSKTRCVVTAVLQWCIVVHL